MVFYGTVPFEIPEQTRLDICRGSGMTTRLFKELFYINQYNDAGMNRKLAASNCWHLLCVIVFLAGCDQAFQPLKENNTAPFSIYGYLDASVDTQWVRVTPIREQLNQPPVKPQMNVTLNNLQRGTAISMQDSLFLRYDGFNYINVWTTMDIAPGQTYRLEAERPDEITTQATVTLPEDFPTPTLLDYGDGCRGTLRIEGVERLADLQSQWHVKILFKRFGEIIHQREELFRIEYRDKTTRIAEGAYSVFIDTIEEHGQILNQLTIPPGTGIELEVLKREIFVASGGPEWIEDIESINDVNYALPEGFSNVKRGVGYMVGIVSKTLTYETCFEDEGLLGGS